MRFIRYRRFHDWKPGNAYAPVPLNHLDVHKAYSDRLEAAIDANIPLLATRLDADANRNAVFHKLLSRNSRELKAVKQARMAAPKREWTPSGEYSAFLRHLYAPKFCGKKVEASLKRLPGSDQSTQAMYINSTHLETLISRSMDHPRLFQLVSSIMDKSHLPRTARELATNVIGISHQGASWRDELARCWPRILESKDVGALNQLLKLALTTHSRDLQRLVQYHLRSQSNRFTYLLKLRYQHDVLPSEIMKEFQAQKFVVDTVMVSSYISGLLRSGRPRGVNSAEDVFIKMVASNDRVKPIIGNSNQVLNTLMALDTVNRLVDGNYEVPLYVDSRLYERMYSHFSTAEKDSAALNTLSSMALHGHILPRHLITSHIHNLDRVDTLEKLFYLCCDFNLAHPGFISNTFADAWAKAISANSVMTYEETTSLVANYRAVTPPVLAAPAPSTPTVV